MRHCSGLITQRINYETLLRVNYRTDQLWEVTITYIQAYRAMIIPMLHCVAKHYTESQEVACHTGVIQVPYRCHKDNFKRAHMPSIDLLPAQANLRWTGYVVGMDDVNLLKQITC